MTCIPISNHSLPLVVCVYVYVCKECMTLLRKQMSEADDCDRLIHERQILSRDT